MTAHNFKVGDWVRVNATYQVATVVGITYGNVLLIVTVPPMLGMGSQSLSAYMAEVTPIPTQTGALPDLKWAIGGDEARLAKVEALAAHPGTPGEGEAARAAVDRLTKSKEKPIRQSTLGTAEYSDRVVY